MSGSTDRVILANEPDFALAQLMVSPSACRVSTDGRDFRVEAQTMAVLVVLTRAASATVTREDLVEACWQGRAVSDDAVARTIAKVRALARNTTPPAFTLETVQKVGYRLLAAGLADKVRGAPPPVARTAKRAYPVAAFVAVGALLFTAIAIFMQVAGPRAPPPMRQADLVAATFSQPVRSTDVADALLNLDEARLHLYIVRGWDPNWYLDSEGNAALHTLLLVCERNPTHDKARLVRVARFLVENGADPTSRNGWRDTPLTIASARRYCGPDHPVVAFLRSAGANAASSGEPALANRYD